MTSSSKPPVGFWTFYVSHFLQEHTHPLNVALHVVGTTASLAYVGGVLWWLREHWAQAPWWSLPLALLLYPVVHAAPGLLGHKLFEPNPNVGDLRVLRTDFPGYWFLAANHVMTFNILTFRHTPHRP